MGRDTREIALSALGNFLKSALLFWGVATYLVVLVVVKWPSIGIWLGWPLIALHILINVPALLHITAHLSRPYPTSKWNWLITMLGIASICVHLSYAGFIYKNLNV
jgi:phosphatidylglycerophosphate synthase